MDATGAGTLLRRMLDKDPLTRATLPDVLAYDWLADGLDEEERGVRAEKVGAEGVGGGLRVDRVQLELGDGGGGGKEDAQQGGDGIGGQATAPRSGDGQERRPPAAVAARIDREARRASNSARRSTTEN